MKKQIFYIGVDAGGTSGKAILADELEKILTERQGDALNYNSVGEKKVKENLRKLLGPILKKTKNRKVYAAFGFAGCNTIKEKKLYEKIVRAILPSTMKFLVVNDAKIALEAKCPGEKNRVLVISGTGSHVFGESAAKQMRSIGWDYILGDEGSGYQFGLQAARTVVQAWDGRGKQTVLTKLLLKELKVKTMDDLLSKVYNDITNKQKSPKYYFASLAPLVDQAIKQNDEIAITIRNRGAADLTKGVAAVGARLKLKDKPFCLGFLGSQWKMPGLRDQVEKKVRQEFPKVRFSHSEDPATLGAIRLAKELK